MIPLQLQARALGDPTRHSIFRYIADAEGPVGVAELTEHLSLNHNAIRQHLAKLLEAGLVIESSLRGGRPGRPRLVYEIDPSADTRWGVLSPYERLSLLLVEKIRSGDPAVDVGSRAARQFRATASTPDEVVSNLTDTMTRLGFEPQTRLRGKRIDVVLGRCPFEAAALADPDTVCSLHLGLAQGLVADTDIVIDGLVVNDPRRARCRLSLHNGAGRSDAQS